MIISPAGSTPTPASSYTIALPDMPINLAAPHIISTSKTIDGGGTSAVWAGNIAGEQRTFSVIVDYDDLVILQNIQESGVYDWLIRTRGRIFRGIVNLVDIMPDRKDRNVFRVQINLHFTSEET